LADLRRQNAINATSKLEHKIQLMKDFFVACYAARDAVTHLCHCHDTDILQQDSVPAHRA